MDLGQSAEWIEAIGPQWVLSSSSSERLVNDETLAIPAVKALLQRDIEGLDKALLNDPGLVSELVLLKLGKITRHGAAVKLSGRLSTHAVSRGWTKSLKTFWERGDRFEQSDFKDIKGAAFYAAEFAKFAALKEMIRLGADVSGGSTISPLAALIPQNFSILPDKTAKTISILLAAGADPFGKSFPKMHASIAMQALQAGNKSVAAALIVATKDHGALTRESWSKEWLRHYCSRPKISGPDLAFFNALKQKSLPLPALEELALLWNEKDKGSILDPPNKKLITLMAWRFEQGEYDPSAALSAIEKIGCPDGLEELRTALSSEVIQMNSNRAVGRPRGVRL